MQQCSMQHCAHDSFTPHGALDFVQTRGQSFWLQHFPHWAVSDRLSVVWRGTQMADVEEAALITIIMACAMKTRNNREYWS